MSKKKHSPNGSAMRSNKQFKNVILITEIRTGNNISTGEIMLISLNGCIKRVFLKSHTRKQKYILYLETCKNICNPHEDSSLPDELSTGNKTFDTHTDVINNLNAFFANMSKNIQQETHNTNEDTEYDPSKLNDYVNSRIPNHVYFGIPKLKLSDLISTLNSLDATKATGLDGISPRILKLAADVIAPTLLTMINTSFQTGHFPDFLKMAKLRPIHKSGSKTDPSNYRPISIIPIFSKVIEKHVTKHLFSFLKKIFNFT